MGRRFASFVLLLAAAGSGGQGFGRFGFTEEPTVPGWRVDRAGLRAAHPRADKLGFRSAAESRRATSLSPHLTEYAFSGPAGSPSALRVNLASPGPELSFKDGFELRVGSLQPPLLSWGEGSVGPGVPTPTGRWALLSFQDSQPPVLLVFLDAPTALQVTGRTGDWRVEVVGTKAYTGWVRFALPLGIQAQTTADAAALGSLVRRVRSEEAFWTSPAPRLIGVSAEADGDAILGVWRFDAPRAVVPFAAFLARRGGYGVQILSPIREIPAPTDEGPLAFVTGSELRLRFPVLPMPRGRGIAVGPDTWRVPSINPARLHTVFSTAMSLMVAARPKPAVGKARVELERFLERIQWRKEPMLGAEMPFGPDGAQAPEVAFYALLLQTLQAGEGLAAKPNALYQSLVWARDAHSWQLAMVGDPVPRRRAQAIAAILGALGSEPEIRLEGAIFQAGLAAERGLYAWRGGNVPKLLEPMDELRNRLYKPLGRLPRRESVLPVLVNPVRVLIGPPLRANNEPGGYVIRWDAASAGPQRLVIQAPWPLMILPRTNVSSIQRQIDVVTGRHDLVVQVAARGRVVLRLRPPVEAPLRLPILPDLTYRENWR